MERQSPRDRHRPSLKHEDEDTRSTSQKELWGWYSYGWAAEVFAICAMGSFLPITLEQLARDQGVLLKDRTTPCNAVHKDPAKHHGELPACVVSVFGAEVNTASFAMYTFSISVFIQSILIISMSGAADHGRYRKTFLLAFGFIGAIATMLFITVVPRIYLFGAFLAIVGNTGFGASFVLLNSFLPLLVRNHPLVQHNQSSDESPEDSDRQSGDHDFLANSSSTLQATSTDWSEIPQTTTAAQNARKAVVSEELKLSTKISGNGIGIGYIAALLLQSVAILIVIGTGNSTFSMRLVLLVVGAWWFLFTVPAALWLRPRPGPPLPAQHTNRSAWLAYFVYAWMALFKTISRARRLKDIVIFLCAWFLLSDSIATVSGTAVLFAKTTLGMKTQELALINIVVTVFGIFGAFNWSYFSRHFNWPASRTIVACICLFEIVPLYGLLGFIPAIKELGVFGLQQPWEMYPVGAVYGLVLGGLSSYCRAFFGELVPPGFEASFYALYAITDKGSSIFGPAVVGAITDRYGEIRPAFVFLAVLIFLPLPLMMLVDVDRGKADAASLAEELEGHTKGHGGGPQYSTIPATTSLDDI